MWLPTYTCIKCETKKQFNIIKLHFLPILVISYSSKPNNFIFHNPILIENCSNRFF